RARQARALGGRPGLAAARHPGRDRGDRRGRGRGCGRARAPDGGGQACSQEEKALTMPDTPNTYRRGPDERGHFGTFGGRYVAETLMPLILDLEKAYN